MIFKIFRNLLGILCLDLQSLALGQSANDANNTAISVFSTSLPGGFEKFNFALNVASHSNDIYFHLSGPVKYSWIAVGTGSEMKDSLMFISYLNSTGNGVTLSPRLSTGENEPRYSSLIDIETLPGTTVSNGTIVVNARCSNCREWKSGSLDLNSTNQPFIYGVGPSSDSLVKIKSNSLSANLERHSVYGIFTMNMTQATGGTDGTSILSASFSSNTTSSGASTDGSQTQDSNWPAIIHAAVISVAFIILMPGGAVLLRIVPASVRWHWVNQSIATVLVGIGGVIGLWLSTMYNRSSSYNSAHQVLGLIGCIAAFLQWFLGFWHHYQYKRHKTPTRYGSIHLYLGRVIPLFAIVIGAIGLAWSSVKTDIVIIYVIISAVIVLVILGLSIWKRHFSGSPSVRPGLKVSRGSMNSDGSYENIMGSSVDSYEYRSHATNVALATFPKPARSG